MIRLAILTFVVLPVLSGCGSSNEKQYKSLSLAEVSGTITFEGRPLQDVQVQFEENGSFSYGVTDSSGKYRMYFDTKHTGVKPGVKTVRLWTTMQGPGFDELMQETYPETEKIPLQYNHESTLTVTVEAKKSQSFDFDVKKDGKTRNAVLNEG